LRFQRERRERLPRPGHNNVNKVSARDALLDAWLPPPADARLKALVITPTRELAFQVRDHLQALSHGTGLRVVAVVGGMSSEKQERLLLARPGRPHRRGLAAARGHWFARDRALRRPGNRGR